MKKKELNSYVDKIVQLHLKDGSYHIGLLEYMPERQFKWGIMPEQFQIGQAYFTANNVSHVSVSIDI